MRQNEEKLANLYFRGSAITVLRFEVFPKDKGKLLVRALVKYPNDYRQQEYENMVYPGDPMAAIICKTLGIKRPVLNDKGEYIYKKSAGRPPSIN